MGYTTKFSGSIDLSRKLTISEAKEIMEIHDEEAPSGSGINGYMQWVPSTDLQSIVWDDGEKFYNYIEWMKWICAFIKNCGIKANGTIEWSGEEVGDTGTIFVVDNVVTSVAKSKKPGDRKVGLTKRGLERMALDLLAKGGA